MGKENFEGKKSGLATAGLVLGIIGICLSFIPILNNASFFLGMLSVIFGIISLIKKASKGKAIAALILGVLSVIITLSLQSSWSKSIDGVSKDLDTATGKSTNEVLKKVDVNIGNFEATSDEFGIVNSKLVVKITNKAKEKKSYNITIEAVSKDGSRIDQDTIYVNNLGAGQSQDFEIFNYVDSDKIDAMKSATFKVVEASMY